MKKILTAFIVMLSISVFSQEKSITGTVTDEAGQPLLGVALIVKGTNTGAITDFDGKYTIKANKGDVIVFSYIGMEGRELTVGDSNTINVSLMKSEEELDEVVVIGYGTVQKSDLTGSVSSVKAEDITKTNPIALDEALAGRAAGVVVTQNSGTPGAGASINIRGISTISSSEPLYVIDGIPMENTPTSDLNSDSTGGSYLSPLSLINPNDIESIEILKDASATAIYGSRATNGVVLITTKMGEIGKGVVDVRHEHSVGTVPAAIDVLDANEYWINANEARLNGVGEGIDPELLAQAEAGVVPTQDWLSILLRPARTTNTNLSFSGGNEDIRYLLSSNLLNSTGVIKKTNFQRIQTRLNLTANVSKKLKVGTRLTYSFVDTDTQATTTNNFQTRGTGSVVRRALLRNPTELLFIPEEEDGDLNDDDDENIQITPLDYLNNNDWNTKQYQFLGNLYADLQLSKSLSFKSTFTYQNRFSKQRFYQNSIPFNNNRNGWARTSDDINTSGSITNQLNFNKKIGKNRLSILLGQSAEWRENEIVRTSNSGFPNDLLGWYNAGLASLPEPETIGFSDSKLLSYFGRVNVSLKNKFLFTFTARYDGSSKFAENNKYGFFPAGAVAYNLSNERFIKNIDAISNAKLRLSYGRTGNQAINEYNSIYLLGGDQIVTGTGTGSEGVTPVFYSSQLSNANLRWETTNQLDVGLDLGLFKNKVTLTADYYSKQTTDLLFRRNEVPPQSGFQNYALNFGEVHSKGFELALGLKIINKPKTRWAMNANFSVGESRIEGLVTDYLEVGPTINGRVPGGTQRLINGEPIGTFYGWKLAGITQFDDFEEFQGLTRQEQIDLYNTDRQATYTYIPRADGSIPQNSAFYRPGEELYYNLPDADGNVDDIIDNVDRQPIGSAQPDFIFGLKNDFTFGNVDFSFFFNGQVGQEVMNILNINLLTFTDRQSISLVKEAWTPENPSNTYPRVRSEGGGVIVMNDRIVEDASFVRLQNVTVGFSLPKKTAEKIGLSALRIYASGNNLYTFTNYTGFNPDTSAFGKDNLSIGHDSAGYPRIRNINLGVNLRF